MVCWVCTGTPKFVELSLGLSNHWMTKAQTSTNEEIPGASMLATHWTTTKKVMKNPGSRGGYGESATARRPDGDPVT